jgi:ABC-2 type transport system ATP-binding protein
MNIIEAQNLSHRYGKTEALRDLTLSVPEGTVCALLGANGAGKTTAIKVVMNLLRPTGGRATVLGVDSRRLSPRELAHIGYVSENQLLPDWMTVRQFLDYCRPFYPTWDRALEAKLLADLDLPEGRRLKELSRGMTMKVALLSSIAYRPRLLVLDEPFSGLDALVREEFVHGMLEVFGAGGWTVFISSHDIEEVERLADTVAFLDRGRLRFSESTESLLGRFRRIEATLGSAVSAEPPPEGCLDWRREGAFVRFVEPAYSEKRLEILGSGALSGARLESKAMTLREIFISIVRNSERPSRRPRP